MDLTVLYQRYILALKYSLAILRIHPTDVKCPLVSMLLDGHYKFVASLVGVVTFHICYGALHMSHTLKFSGFDHPPHSHLLLSNCEHLPDRPQM